MSSQRIGEKIKHAASNEEIGHLLALGTTFSEASDKTKRRWEKLARRRRFDLKQKERERANV
jgi:hypothetical protein